MSVTQSRSSTASPPPSLSQQQHRQISISRINPNVFVDSLSEASSSSLNAQQHQQAAQAQQQQQQSSSFRQIQVPVWQRDEDVDTCFNCGVSFKFWNRKHHCRKCGRVVCNTCSLHFITYLPSTYVVSPPWQIFLESPHVVHRTCDPCYEEVEMVRNALSDSLVLQQQQGAGGASSSENCSTKDLSSSRTLDIRIANNNNTQEAGAGAGVGLTEGENDSDNDSLRNRCPVCNKFIGCLAEQQKEEHINECLINLEFSGSPKQKRTNNRMLVYKIPTENQGISIPAIDSTLLRDQQQQQQQNVEIGFDEMNLNGNPSTSADTLNVTSTATGVLNLKSGIFNHEEEDDDDIYDNDNEEEDDDEQDEKGDRECVICFEEFEPGDKVARMECLCVFHYRCIKDWFKKKGERECPVHALHYN